MSKYGNVIDWVIPDNLSCTVFRTPGDAAPATYAGPPSVRRPGPARRRRLLPNKLVARLGNIL
jgi:hypothetical protein